MNESDIIIKLSKTAEKNTETGYSFGAWIVYGWLWLVQVWMKKLQKNLKKGVDKWNLIWYNNQAVTESDNKIWSLKTFFSRFQQKSKENEK